VLLIVQQLNHLLFQHNYILFIIWKYMLIVQQLNYLLFQHNYILFIIWNYMFQPIPGHP